MGPENLFSGPIPGQSLTRSPDQRAPYEMPPKFPDTAAAMDHLLLMVHDEKFIRNFATLVRKNKKMYVDKMVSAILQQGFVHGMWTVDTAMLLIEPLLCLLVWAAAQQDATVTFSTDTGYEDRTGFDYVTDALVGNPNDIAISKPTDKEVIEKKDVVEDQPRSPLLGGQ